ncbi:MAG TPA: MBG domain-containing protein [Symbiobacteriaceae bacterium]|nr:MBG domain-containing protein [Symbiobacteriaceae bacterium]
MGQRLSLVRLALPVAAALALLQPGHGEAGGQVATMLSIEPVNAVYGDSVTVAASLTDADTGAGIPGQAINFLVNGRFYSAVTNASGEAVLSGLRPGRLNAGTYDDGVQARFDGHFGSTVYEPSTGSAAVVVERRPLRVIPAAVSREYGDENPAAFAYRLENFALSDDEHVLDSLPTCSTTAVPASDVGIYEITCDGLVADNYVADYADGTLTVTPAPMLIKADDQSRRFGEANPPFTAKYVGRWKLGQGPAVLAGVLKCGTRVGAMKWTPPGVYEIFCTGQTASNYALKYVEGKLRIFPTR